LALKKTLREQRLQEQEEAALESAYHAEQSRVREAERQRLNDQRHNEELQRRQEAISR
jgi:hypothetical protein